jgi:hypothetical protein
LYKPLQKWYKRERKLNENGYWLVKVPEHPKSFCGGWYYEHRLIAERQFGRVLESWETVHHISEDKTDCSTLNLFVCTRKEHDRAIWLTWNPA